MNDQTTFASAASRGSAAYLAMTSDRAGRTESGKDFPVGTTVKYLGHVLGGMVRVRMIEDGSNEVVHPHCFRTLR